ncbi:MAG: hypothetical protein HC903_19040 [Methylacidiphilales bacterium]|nr:hypothetical protein [Candidatus Methylacidiphilales bacterium]NJR17123.1 hypothetical protein [Calothrix sp. CSU_2_0]
MIINKKVWRRHKTEIIFISLALVAAAFSHQDIQRGMQSLSSERARITSNGEEQRRLEQNQELAKTKAAIAENRYKTGCTIVVAVNSPKNLATLVENEPILDRTTKKYLPNGTTVCDGNGNTAILAPNSQGIPVATDFAFNGDRELALQQVRKIRGAKVYYFTPEK